LTAISTTHFVGAGYGSGGGEDEGCSKQIAAG